MHSRALLAILAGLALVSGSTAAQSRNDVKKGTVVCSVYDPANKMIPGAALRLTNTDNQTKFEALTNDSGNYSFEVPPGKYLLQAGLQGFETASVSNINLGENQTQRFNITLRLIESRII